MDLLKIISPLFFLFSIIVLNKFFKSQNSNTSPQNFHKGSYSRLGGLLIIISFLIINFDQFSLLSKCIIISISLIGFADDVDIVNNPTIRFFFLSTFVIIFLYLRSNEIKSFYFYENSIGNLDNIILNFSIFLLFLFFLALINGYNFIDGFNGLLSFIFLNQLVVYAIIFQNISEFLLLIISILIFLYFNINKNIFLGDAGAYFVAIFNIIVGLKIVNLNPSYIYTIIILNLYPFIEVSFSFFRKIYMRKNPMKPDHLHLHMLFYYFLCEKKFFQSKISYNTQTGLIIGFIYSLIFLISYYFSSNTLIQILIINFTFFSYLLLYFYLYRRHQLSSE